MPTRKRKYYKVLINRICPYALVNGSYYKYHYLYAYSEDGAYRSVEKYYRGGYGDHIIKEVIEIPKDEFKGQHMTEIINDN